MTVVPLPTDMADAVPEVSKQKKIPTVPVPAVVTLATDEKKVVWQRFMAPVDEVERGTALTQLNKATPPAELLEAVVDPPAFSRSH